MGQGINLARSQSPLHAEVLDNFKDQLLIVFVKRMGGNISIPVSETDDTGQDILSMSVKDGIFNFSVSRKS